MAPMVASQVFLSQTLTPIKMQLQKEELVIKAADNDTPYVAFLPETKTRAFRTLFANRHTTLFVT